MSKKGIGYKLGKKLRGTKVGYVLLVALFPFILIMAIYQLFIEITKDFWKTKEVQNER